MSAGYDVFPGITQLPVEYDKVKISLLFFKTDDSTILLELD